MEPPSARCYVLLLLSMAVFHRGSCADCSAYRIKVEQVPRGLLRVVEEVTILILKDCRLETPIEDVPDSIFSVEFYNVEFGSNLTWKEVAPLNVEEDFKIVDSTFEDETVLERLNITNLGKLLVYKSGLTRAPNFGSPKNCQLRKANFSSNSISLITSEAFDSIYKYCTILEDYDVSFNRIDIFPTVAVQNVAKCKLHIDNNPLDCYRNDGLVNNQRTRDMLVNTPTCLKDGRNVPFWFHDVQLCTICKCFIRLDVHVDCSYRNLTTMPSRLPRQTTHLDISGNQIRILVDPRVVHNEYKHIKVLNASRNPLIDIESFRVCELIVLDVSHARLETFSAAFVDMLIAQTCRPLLTMGRLLIGNNPWRCDCDAMHLKLLLGVKAREIDDFSSIQCNGDGEEIWRTQPEQLCPPPVYELNVWDVAIGVMFVLLCLIIYKTITDYFKQKHTGKLPKFFIL